MRTGDLRYPHTGYPNAVNANRVPPTRGPIKPANPAALPRQNRQIGRLGSWNAGRRPQKIQEATENLLYFLGMAHRRDAPFGWLVIGVRAAPSNERDDLHRSIVESPTALTFPKPTAHPGANPEDLQMQLIFDVWREVCRHLEIHESVERLLPRLAESLPLDALAIRRIDRPRSCLE